jgi:exodeoxyribonuclease V beta subunit
MRKGGVSWEAADMKRICSALKFQPVRGMLRGFMDLVFEQEGRFYILDWKSNHLGYRPEDYGREAIREEMIRHLYPLQYLLYTVALHRFLSLRVRGYDYATHFGGVIYVFLRGVGTRRSEEFGFFRDNPPRDLIEAMTEILVHVEEKGGGNGL